MSRPYLSYLSPRGDRADDRVDDAVDDELDYDYGYGYDEFADYDDYPPDRRWLWVAGVAGVVLLVAVVGTAVILGGGDSGTVSATVAPTTPRTVIATPTARPSPPAPSATSSPPATSLPPETLTTVTPSPSATAAPTPAPAEAPAVNPRTVVYQVTGNRQLIDLVTVIYTDAQGALQTDVNVALPWAKTIVLDPGVELSSITATSVGGQLNCSITDAAGATIAAQNNNTMITTCTK